MQPQIDIKVDPRQIKAIQRALRGVKNGLPKAMSRAVNKTADAARGHIARELVKKSALKLKAIRAVMKVSRATYTRWSATVHTGGKRIALFRFGGRKGRKRQAVHEATGGQAAKIFSRIFKDRYGEQAIFSRHYTIKQEVYDQGTYIKDGRRVPIQADAWFAEVKHGHKTFIKRNRQSSSQRGTTELKGPSPGGLFAGAPTLIRRIQEESYKKLQHHLDQQVAAILKQQKGR